MELVFTKIKPMKKIILIHLALLTAFVSYAQSNSAQATQKEKTTNAKAPEVLNPDGVIMKKGTMMMVQNGVMSNLTNDFICKDGTKVTMSGYVIKKDGSKLMLKEGEYVDATGKIASINDVKTPSDKINSKPAKDNNMYLVPDSTLKNK